VSATAFAQKDYQLKDSYKFKNEKIIIKKWKKSLKSGSPKRRYFPELSNPIFENDKVFVGTQGKIFYAIDVQKGKILWEYENDEPIAATASIFGDRVYFSDLGGKLICLEKNTGELIWENSYNREILGKPLITGKKVYFLKGEKELVAVSPVDGRAIFSRIIRTYIRDLTMHGHSDLVLDNGSLYLGLADGHLYRFNASNGKVLWDRNLSVPLRTFKDIDASVVVDGDSLFVSGYFGKVYRVNKKSGKIIWSSEATSGIPVLVMNDLVVVSDQSGTVYGLDKDTGVSQWYNELDASVLSAPVKFGEHIFVTNFDKRAYLIDPATGNEVQRLSLDGGAITKPVISGDSIYLMTNGATLIALKKNAR